MRKLWPAVGIALAWLAGGVCGGQTIMIRADRILDGRGGILQGPRMISIEGPKIVAISPTASAPPPADYDLTGLTVLPGLIDVHDHISWHFNREGRTHTDDDGETAAQGALAASGDAWATLLSGFTIVQSPGSASDKDLRDAIAAGSIPGPRILTSLEPLTEKTGTAEEIRRAVRQRAAAGADLIKIFASKSIRDGGAETMTQDQLEAACGEARARGLRSLVHAHNPESMRRAALGGCTEVEHGIFATDEVLRLLAERGTYFDPQCGLVFRNYLENKSRFLGVGNYTEEGFAAMERALPLAVATFRRALGTPGLKIVFGTDAVAGAHGRNAEELVCRVREGGQKPMDAIVSATSLAARSLNLQDTVGSLAAGMQADLIAVQGDPLKDMAALKDVVFVMKAGKVYKNTARVRGAGSAPARAPAARPSS